MSIAGYRKEIHFRARLSLRRNDQDGDTQGTDSTGLTTGTASAGGVISYPNSDYAAVGGAAQGREVAQLDWTRWTRGQLPGSSGSLSLSGELLDDTNFFSQGWMSRVVGLRDWSITGSAFYQEESTDATNPTSIIRQAWAKRQPVQIAYLPDGKNGFYGLCEIETLDLSGDVSGLETFDFTFQANGPLYSFFTETGNWPDGATINASASTTIADQTFTNALRAHVRSNGGSGTLPPFYDPDFDAPAN